MANKIRLTHYSHHAYLTAMKLRDWRKAENMTGAELAPLLGLSQGSLSKIETGKQWPDRETMERIVAVSDGAVTANDFLSEAPSDSEAAE
jgi:transcriptional regulator with XRE-family HTH domain